MSTNSGTHFYEVAPVPKYRVRLVTSDAEYQEVLRALDWKHPERWNTDSYACLYTLMSGGDMVFVVGVNQARWDEEKIDPIVAASFLTHEAVHIKQRIMEQLGEDMPSKEFEAYTIQNVSYSLMEQYKEKVLESNT